MEDAESFGRMTGDEDNEDGLSAANKGSDFRGMCVHEDDDCVIALPPASRHTLWLEDGDGASTDALPL